MKKKMFGLVIMGLISVIMAASMAISAVSYRHERDNIKYTGNYIFSGTTVEFSGTTVRMNPTWLSLVSGNTLLYATGIDFSSGVTFTGGVTMTTGSIYMTATESHTGAITTSGTGTHSGANTFSGGVTNTNGLTISGGVTNTGTYSVFSGSTVEFTGTTVVLNPTWTRITGTNLTVSSTETHSGSATFSGAVSTTSTLTTSGTGTHSGENTFSGGVTNTGTVKMNGKVQKAWVAPTWVSGYGFAISGTTSNVSYFKVDTSLATGMGGAAAPGAPLTNSGATIILPAVTSDMDGLEFTFVVISGTTTAWFSPASGTIQTASGTTGLNIASQPDLTGDSVTWVAAYDSGVSWYVKSTFIQ